jgi:antitoxin PrlF
VDAPVDAPPRKGQVTLPEAVRDALGLHEGDRVVFRVEGSYAVLARTTDLLELAGSVPVSLAQRGADWEDVRNHARRARVARLDQL